MSAVSLLEDKEDRTLDDAIRLSEGAVTALWFEQRQAHHKEAVAALAALRAARAEAKAEAEARRLERQTSEMVEGQLLWFDVIKDVKPLKRAD